jgi:uncharacterized protein YbaP (TraB family)
VRTARFPTRGLLLAALLSFGCNNDAPVPAKTVQGSAAKPAVADPWNTPAPKRNPNDLPTLVERIELANKACPSVTGPFFFELVKHGKTSHILGTRHISVGLAKFPSVVGTTLDAASLVVFEIGPDDVTAGSHVSEPLKDELGPKDWSHFEELIGADAAKRYIDNEPDAAALSMMVLYEDISNLLESQLQQRARAHRIRMSGLETSAFQDGVLAKLLDLRMLKATIEQTKDRAEIEADSRKDLSEYCAGTDDSPGMDEESREKMLKSGYTKVELDAMDEVLVFKRNADWIPKLSKLFEQDHVFVAVGADHLIGPRGVIELMKAQGFEVKRIAK